MWGLISCRPHLHVFSNLAHETLHALFIWKLECTPICLHLENLICAFFEKQIKLSSPFSFAHPVFILSGGKICSILLYMKLFQMSQWFAYTMYKTVFLHYYELLMHTHTLILQWWKCCAAKEILQNAVPTSTCSEYSSRQKKTVSAQVYEHILGTARDPPSLSGSICGECGSAVGKFE